MHNHPVLSLSKITASQRLHFSLNRSAIMHNSLQGKLLFTIADAEARLTLIAKNSSMPTTMQNLGLVWGVLFQIIFRPKSEPKANQQARDGTPEQPHSTIDYTGGLFPSAFHRQRSLADLFSVSHPRSPESPAGRTLLK